ncbi:AAA domain-containing protein [Amycolatopsis sp. NPDC024027]|uniref:DEAD/DEAH box helicase n=1 Tax=Amycolatopsis sp. NPDC024027 TaxID=3154327 RepID=UPI00340003BE
MHESLTAPVPLHRRDRWTPFPLSFETVLCGGATQLPAPAPVSKLFEDLAPLEGVFYGWPTLVVRDRRGRPHVASLFIRGLDEPESAPGGPTAIPLNSELPHINTALLGPEWFDPELLGDVATVLADKVIGFGVATAMTDVTRRILTALGLPDADIDPRGLHRSPDEDDLWRPQEAGVFNLAMAFKGELDYAVRGLVKDLDWMARADDWQDSAARFLFETWTPEAPLPLEAGPIRLNRAQEHAVSVAATSPLTVITGPPGTGKSQTVTAIIAEAWRRGESVLLSSTNNKPVDDVVTGKAAQLDRALVLRTGNAEKRQELGSALTELVDEAAGRPVGSGFENLAEVTNDRRWAELDLQHHAELGGQVLTAAVHRDELRARTWRHQLPSPTHLPGIEKLANRVLRTRWRWLRRRRDRKFRGFAAITDPTVGAEEVVAWFAAERTFDHHYGELRRFLEDHPGDLPARLEDTDVLWREASESQVRELVRLGITGGSSVLLQLSEALTEELRCHDLMKGALRHAKGWATSALSTRPNFACSAAQIDLVVIDEASQCSLAQVLPLAYRAKRLVIVGDPHQLPPVVTADPGQLRWLAQQSGTTHPDLAARHHTYGDDSAFSAFAARFRPEPLLLDEHYRCHPDIIRFCNEEFYRNQLKVLTRVEYPEGARRGMHWHEVSGRTRPGPTGSVINEIEAQAIADWLATADVAALGSVGVVTPFRAQANLIERLLEKAGPHQVEVGTAHTFQGGERDTILFSTVVSEGAQPGTIGWLESQRNLINVAVSRARRELVVFGNDRAIREHGPRTLRALAEMTSGRSSASAAPPSAIVRRLHAALTARGIPAELGRTVEGYPIAIAITGRSGTLIDLEVSELPDGDPGGGLQRAFSLRDSNLRALGWQVLRIPDWQAYLEAGEVVSTVLRTARA